MKISTNSIRSFNARYHTADDPSQDGIEDLVEKIGSQLGGVEEVIPLGQRFSGIPVVKVVSCVDHSNSDHLHICKVDDGGVVKDVPRDAEGLVQVITGAPNIRDNFVCAWLPPGATVPESLDKEPFVLAARPLRGEMSYGMLASAKELGLGDDHNGIMELDPDIAPGTWLADAYDLEGDYLIDIENKMFTHRPDCFGFIGIGRELSAIYHRPYKSPDWYVQDPVFPTVETDELPLTVSNEIPDLVSRFVAITMRNVEIKPSPIWLQIELSKYGIRAINNIVDYSNFFMLETGQPIHIYDYDKVRALSGGEQVQLIVRHPEKGEKITLLNGKTIEPGANTMMVATDTQSICLGGAMGGENSEVDEHTKNIIIEAANWDMYTMRRTSMAYGIFSDAVTRFTKGQSPLQNLAVLAKIVDEIRKYASGLVASQVIDDNHLSPDAIERGNISAPVTVSREFIVTRLGLSVSSEDIAGLLRNAEFKVDVSNEDMVVYAPFWRTDIAIPEDIVEEVGRLYGYDKLPLTLPKRDLTPAIRDATYDLKNRVANYLRQSGANEVLTYSFVHGRLLQHVGQNTELAFRLSNALSPDLQYYRLSLTPSLLDKVHANVKAGYDSFGLFELNKVHIKDKLDDEKLPKEFQRIGFVFSADGSTAKRYVGASYFVAKKYLDELFRTFGLEQSVTYEPYTGTSYEGDVAREQMVRPFEPVHSAFILKDGRAVGIVGEYRTSVREALKLPKVCAGFELDLSSLEGVRNYSYIALPRFPRVERDVNLQVLAGTSYQRLYDFVQDQIAAKQLGQVHITIIPVDIYQPEGEEKHVQITLRFSVASYERTLTGVAVNDLLDKVVDEVSESAERLLNNDRPY